VVLAESFVFRCDVAFRNFFVAFRVDRFGNSVESPGMRAPFGQAALRTGRGHYSAFPFQVARMTLLCSGCAGIPDEHRSELFVVLLVSSHFLYQVIQLTWIAL
jgi:hypothetical protein